MLIKLAWRNLWRQKRRTFLTAAALALALFLSLLTRTLQEGTYAANIENAARFYTGLIQIQHPEYADSLSIDDVIPQTSELINELRNNPDIDTILPRIESFALAAAGDKSKGVLVLGVMPELENRYSEISNKLVEGEFLSNGDRHVLINEDRHENSGGNNEENNRDRHVLVGEGVADYFHLEIGDELVLYGQGYRGQTAAGLYRVKGILRFPMPQLDNQIIYLSLPLAQELYSTGEQITAWVLHIKTLSKLDQTISDLKSRYGSNVNVRSWEDIAPEMAQQIMMDKAGGVFMIYVLYGVVGFGLFATILMMTLERQREFGVMLATGLLRIRLVQLVVIESFCIALIGIFLGLLVSAPVLAYLYFHPIEFSGETAQMMIDSGFEPIMPVLLAPYLFIDQIIAVITLLVICLVYPLIRIYKLDMVSALKGGAHAH